MSQLGTSVRSELRFFTFWLFNGTLARDVLLGDAYLSAIKHDFYASDWEQLFAIWSNNLELDDAGVVVNSAHATRRAAQFIRSHLDPNFTPDPPFDEWEIELH